MSDKEFFDLAELPLNSPDQAWGNLGYWREADDYSSACRELAVLLGERLALSSESVVFDAGFGCGDQLLLWLQQFQVGQLFGVNFSSSQTAYALSQLQRRGLAPQAEISEGCVESAAAWSAVEASEQPVNRVIALDCAYHFPSRQNFFTKANQLLPDAGRIGLTDFVLGDGFRGRAGLLGGLMFRLSKIPRGNMVTESQYRDELAAAGFKAIEIEDISAEVMPKFGQWLRGFKRDNLRIMPRAQWLKYDGTARFLAWAYRKKLLRYVVVIADK